MSERKMGEDRKPAKRKPYVPPQIEEQLTFERAALQTGKVAGDNAICNAFPQAT